MNEKPQVAIIGLSGQSIFLHVDHFHKQGETLVSDDLFMEPGGKGFNQSVALKRLGAGVSFLSAVGKDDYGKICQKTLLDLGIETSFKFKDNQQTALASILTNSQGETKVTVYPGAKLTKDDVEQFSSSIDKAGALLLQLEVPDEVLIEAIKIASRKQKMIILNPAPFRKIPSPVMQSVSVLTPNEIEARSMVGLSEQDDWEEVVKRLKSLNKTIVVTLGYKGAFYINKEEEGFIPAPVVKCQDSTGAGDAFNAALTYQLLNKKPLKDAIVWANIVAAMSVTKHHVLRSYPTKEEVSNFMKAVKYE